MGDIGFVSLLAGAVASLLAAFILYILGFFRRVKVVEKTEKTYGEKISELMSSLMKASSEADKVIEEIASVAHERSEGLQKLENELANMEICEKELKDRIDALQNVPIPATEHFAKLVKSGEKRNARRDYFLFGSGVVVTTIVAIIIQLFFNKG